MNTTRILNQFETEQKITTDFVKYFCKFVGVFALLATLSACKGGSGVNGVLGSLTSSDASITVDTTYPTSSGTSWTPIKDSNGTYYIKGSSLSFSGTCTRGVANVVVLENGTQFSEQAPCDTSGHYTWTRDFGSGVQANHNLTVSGMDSNGTVFAGVSKNVRVDDYPPNAPVITSPTTASTYMFSAGDSITISGTIAPDVVRMTGPNSSDTSAASSPLSISGTTFTQTIPITAGQQNVYSFYGYDLAGNMSAAATLTVTFAARLAVAGPVLGGRATDSVTHYSSEISSGPFPIGVSDSLTSYSILTGFNYLVNQVRAGQ